MGSARAGRAVDHVGFIILALFQSHLSSFASGYADHFCDLTTGLEDEILELTEQKGF